MLSTPQLIPLPLWRTPAVFARITAAWALLVPPPPPHCNLRVSLLRNAGKVKSLLGAKGLSLRGLHILPLGNLVTPTTMALPVDCALSSTMKNMKQVLPLRLRGHGIAQGSELPKAAPVAAFWTLIFPGA